MLKNFKVGFYILISFLLINCQDNIKSKTFYYVGAGVKSEVFQLEFSSDGNFAKIYIKNTCKDKSIEFLKYKVEYSDDNNISLKLITKPYAEMEWKEIYNACYDKYNQTSESYSQDLLMAKQISGRKLIIQSLEQTIRIKISTNSYFVYEK